jgi:SAM-dependent methyltransferase
VKRAQVEFHSFASLGEPDRALRVYAKENEGRGSIIRKHLEFIGEMSPFLEIGANAGHTSYMLCNEFGAGGFALDLSADALRHGMVLQDAWGMAQAPVRIAGDALNLPFRDNSLRLVVACQMLSQFLDIEAVFLEVKRVLAPGGVFLFIEEPIRRMLSLRLYRCPYYETMKPWERKLVDWGLLGFLVKDVIGAHQEESFGIRQNHRMGLNEWQRLIDKHFVAREFDIFVARRGWGERFAHWLARRIDRYGSDWVPARLLGGTLAAACRKAGEASTHPAAAMDCFQTYLCCPDCRGGLSRGQDDTLSCAACGYTSPNEGGVYNILPGSLRSELYPGDRDDAIDFSIPGHERRLVDGWYGVEGVFGNKYRWIGERATAKLRRVRSGPQLLRVRGFAHERMFEQGQPVRVEVSINHRSTAVCELERNGLFLIEAPAPDADEHLIEVRASPLWRTPTDDRALTVNLSMIRLVARE